MNIGLKIAFFGCAALFTMLTITALHGLPSLVANASDSLVSFGVDQVISITTSPENSLSIPITPSGSGAYSTRKLTASVGTNNDAGFTLTFSAGPAGTSLVNSAAVSNNTLQPSSGSVAVPVVFALNTWGFAVPKTQTNSVGLIPNVTSGFGNTYSTVTNAATLGEAYATLPTQASPLTLKSTTTPTNLDSTDLFFGARVDLNKPSGSYTGTVVFTATANYVPPVPPTPPDGSNPDNISTTNSAVVDVYPTTGWEGDVVAITSWNLFTNVQDVTIGGTSCTDWGVISTSLITCELPAKVAGTSNNIAVINNGSDVTPSTSFTGMKVTYFDPNSSSVTIASNSTTYSYFPNGFTSANCASLTASNSTIAATPATSMVYVRDTRNNQVYKVKKMIDGKCWMVDNLKYISTTIANTADSTVGMTYNNGDHKNDGGYEAYNSVDESITVSAANSNKAFYNNPASSCGSVSYQSSVPALSLTNCGYQYNWYSATNGTGTYAQGTNGNQASGSICPANFRLPTGSSGGTATSNGTTYTASDFAVLNASMNAGSLATGNTSYLYGTNWRPASIFGGAYSGMRVVGNQNAGQFGYYWSSTANSAANARYISIGYTNSVSPGGDAADSKNWGLAVRCVMQ